MYSEKVMDHFNHPRNVGEIENASGVGTVGNAKCGDIKRIYLDIDDDGIIRDVKFKTFGNRTGKRQKYPGSNAGYQQSRYGSFGRTASCKSTLFSACRRSHPCSTVGLRRETPHQDRRTAKAEV